MAFDYEAHRKKQREEQDRKRREASAKKKQDRISKEKKLKKQQVWDERRKKMREETEAQAGDMAGTGQMGGSTGFLGSEELEMKEAPIMNRGFGSGGGAKRSKSKGKGRLRKPGTKAQNPQEKENGQDNRTVAQNVPKLRRPF